jgi:hypothetical protein
VRLAEGSQPALDQRRIGQNPAVRGGMVHRQAALPEQLLDVAIAQGIPQIPGDGLQDQRRLEVPAFSRSAIALRIMALLRFGAIKSTTMPDEPSTPGICDRPPEKHEPLSATPGNLMLSRPFTGFSIALCERFKVTGFPKKGLNQLRGSLCPDRAVGVRGWLA